MTVNIIKPFAGAGGRDEALRMLGRRDTLGIEIDRTTCETARAAGHARLQADVAALDPLDVAPAGIEGHSSSPICRGFSIQGHGGGRLDSQRLIRAVGEFAAGRDPRADLHEHMHDDRSVLSLEPIRWTLALRPQWTAWEQVPAVLPLWEACADVLRDKGYSVATGVLHAEQYGVPQARSRAVLLASRQASARLPAPTHSRYYRGDPTRLDRGLPRWVSMAEAIGWGMTHRPSMTVTGGGVAAGGPETFGNAARKGMQRELDAGRWAPRVGGGRLGAISIPDAARLQSLRPDYPFQGGKGQQACQVGDMVPPLLDAHCFQALGVGTLAANQAA